MDVMTYVLLAYTIILGGMYGWRQYTARQRDTARKELAGLQALGKYQSDSSNKINKHNDKLKEELDEKFNNIIDHIDADRVSNASRPRNLSRSIEQLSRSELLKRLSKAETALKIVHEWRNRVRG